MSKRVIAWLRGDPESIACVRSVRELLNAQGIRVILPRGDEYLDASILVLPVRGSPEEEYFREAIESFNGPMVREEDPLRALVYAITYPRRGFRKLVFGVDPGKKCGLAGLGDSIIIAASKVDCDKLGSAIREHASRIPAWKVEVYVGNGYGFSEAVDSLAREGIGFRVVDESGTTGSQGVGSVARIIRDRDIIAGITIALRGAYGVKRVDSSFYKEV